MARPLALALQGGGSHGAFTWGVLDRLLADGRFDIAGLCGTSSGALNAAVLAQGLAEGGPERARALLAELWRRIAAGALLGPLQPSPFDRLVGDPDLRTSPTVALFDLGIRMFSPYQFNPLGHNPLKGLLGELVDIALLRRLERPRLLVAATDVRRGLPRIFQGEALSLDAILASACLPFLFPAVEIEGRAYWDGGYSGNPPLTPLIRTGAADDLLIVQTVPLERPEVPTQPTAIVDRMTEVGFNGILLRELAGIERINRLLADGHLSPAAGLRPVRLHLVAEPAAMAGFGVASKLNGDAAFLRRLFEMGAAAAESWLAQHGAAVGRRASFAPPRLDP
ncbi:MAG TPA: patatin-like phospholipase family protein [Alphaproteobacteria bacterium]|nr:patatin-like phospholipase family protein [Alphaproteobacteria bacterium]